jgi:hypothetical protein
MMSSRSESGELYCKEKEVMMMRKGDPGRRSARVRSLARRD